jgi:hypothetical protein
LVGRLGGNVRTRKMYHYGAAGRFAVGRGEPSSRNAGNRAQLIGSAARVAGRFACIDLPAETGLRPYGRENCSRSNDFVRGRPILEQKAAEETEKTGRRGVFSCDKLCCLCSTLFRGSAAAPPAGRSVPL